MKFKNRFLTLVTRVERFLQMILPEDFPIAMVCSLWHVVHCSRRKHHEGNFFDEIHLASDDQQVHSCVKNRGKLDVFRYSIRRPPLRSLQELAKFAAASQKHGLVATKPTAKGHLGSGTLPPYIIFDFTTHLALRVVLCSCVWFLTMPQFKPLWPPIFLSTFENNITKHTCQKQKLTTLSQNTNSITNSSIQHHKTYIHKTKLKHPKTQSRTT